MRIKKHSNKNEYLLTEDGIWVRNFCKRYTKAVDINSLSNNKDHNLFLKNELHNLKQRYAVVEQEHYDFSNLAIVSDGYNFDNKQELLCQLEGKIVVMAVNGALIKWRLTNQDREVRRGVSCYVVNNPHAQCMAYLPQNNYYPPCIASSKTNPDFLEAYRNVKYLYRSTPNRLYSGPRLEGHLNVDDYRNPICAGIHLAHKFGVKKLLLFCCDDSFDDERPAAIKLENDLWTYSQQLVGQRIIDGMLYWLRQAGVEVGYHSSGINFNNATYIPDSELSGFFKEEQQNELQRKQILTRKL